MGDRCREKPRENPVSIGGTPTARMNQYWHAVATSEEYLRLFPVRVWTGRQREMTEKYLALWLVVEESLEDEAAVNPQKIPWPFPLGEVLGEEIRFLAGGSSKCVVRQRHFDPGLTSSPDSGFRRSPGRLVTTREQTMMTVPATVQAFIFSPASRHANRQAKMGFRRKVMDAR